MVFKTVDWQPFIMICDDLYDKGEESGITVCSPEMYEVWKSIECVYKFGFRMC